jgi:DNA-binding transcriptional LysR family regulator
VDRLDELTVFLAIVDAGTLAAAARRTRRSPPAVTRILSELERRLGVKLVERNTRRLALTDAGQRLAEHARRLLGDFEDAMRDTAGEMAEPRGRLRISAPLVFGRRYVAPIVTAFLDAYPAVSVELSLADRVVDLIEDGIDVALRVGQIENSSIVARRVGQVRRVLVASPGYLARCGVPMTPDQLSQHEMVLLIQPRGGTDLRFPGTGDSELTVRVTGRFQVDRVEVAIAAAREHRGVLATLSYQVAPELAAGALVRILRDFEPPPIPVQLVFPSARLMPRRTRAFLDYAAPRLSALSVLRPDCGAR